MLKQTFTMPQAFMEDPNVAVKWKLFGIINGFWLNGLTVYASNKFFAEKVGVAERNVRAALEELEELGVIRRQIDGHNRLILPAGEIREEDAQHPGGGRPASAAQDAQHPPNAFSNSLSKNGANALPYEIKQGDAEGNILPLKDKSKDAKRRAAYEYMCKWAEDRRGFSFVERGSQYAALKRAKEAGIKAAELKERWEEMESDSYWSANGFDWANVVKSFNKKRHVG